MRTVLIGLIIIVFALNTSRIYGQSNEGRDFWLGFMEHRDLRENRMVVMITSRFNTAGTIEVAGRQYSENFEVGSDEVTVIELPGFVETIGSEFVNNNAIHITAQNDISVYMHQYFGMRSEASIVLPNSSVGKEYYVICYTGIDEGFGPPGVDYPSEFLIVANEDETVISYTLSGDTQNQKRKGETHTIVLNRGEVYQVRSSSWDTDLTGTFIQADKNFSVFAGTPWSQVPRGCFAMDNLLEQMYPISTWGTRYVGSSFALTSVDLFRIIASEDETKVSIEGSLVQEVLLNAGEFYDFETRNGTGAFIESDKPISVAQYMVGSSCNDGLGDPSMVILNTVDQIRDNVTLFNSSFFAIDQNFINVICKNGEEDLIFFDGASLVESGIDFISIDADQNFLYAVVPTTVGAHNITTQGCGIIAMAYGYGNVESYAYSGGAAFAAINENPIPEGGCLSDTIFFDTGLPPKRFNVTWDLGDGTNTDKHRFQHQYDDLGSYPLSLIIEDICFDDIDTLYKDLQITLRQDIEAIEDQYGCEGTKIDLGAFDLQGAMYEWRGPNDYEALDQFPSILNAQVSDAGLYEVVGNISGCKTFPVPLMVEVYNNPKPYLGMDTVICTIDGDEIRLNAGSYEEYLWQDASSQQIFDVDSDGQFSVEVLDSNGCIGRDTIQIITQCPTRFYVPNIFSPNGDGINDDFGISGLDIIAMDLKVYDRWGQLIYQSNDPSERWDGTFTNNELTGGRYIWILEYQGYLEDGTTFEQIERGDVLLFR